MTHKMTKKSQSQNRTFISSEQIKHQNDATESPTTKIIMEESDDADGLWEHVLNDESNVRTMQQNHELQK